VPLVQNVWTNANYAIMEKLVKNAEEIEIF
jgi:hypothetical protein